jgi:Zn-finger nucleic acid-binding protein
MELRAAGDAEIDVCPTCRGLWLDWFDGETMTLVELAMPLSVRPAAPRPAQTNCPRCIRPLEANPGAADDVTVWRCGECAGTFLPRATAIALLFWASSSPQSPAGPETPLLERLLRALRALFGPAPTDAVS